MTPFEAPPRSARPRAGLALLVLGAHLAVLWAAWPGAPASIALDPERSAAPMVARVVWLEAAATEPGSATDGARVAVSGADRVGAEARGTGDSGAGAWGSGPPPAGRPMAEGPDRPSPSPEAPRLPGPSAGREAATPEPVPEVLAQAPPPAPPPEGAEPDPRMAGRMAGLSLAAAGTAPAAAERPPAGGDTPEPPPPTYATRVPEAALLRYTMRRGAMSGQGVLHWRLLPEATAPGRAAAGGPSYRLDFVGRAFGALLLGWHSEGRLDAHGLAPDRFVDRRRQRGALAANFQRGRGVISYSGEGEDVPLLPGAQDRLSWMVQLPAIVAAQPALARPGATVAMLVTGARGDADVWSFRVIDRQDLNLPAGAVQQALHLRREPRKPRDTRVEVWLDPARQWLPVRLRLSPTEGGEGTEFLLSGEGGPPPEGPN